MEPALEQAGLRKFRFHDLRHTFGSLLIQAGISPAYVQKQIGHKSIQVTIDVYGHLIPGENVALIDTLDSTPKKATARTHTSRTRGQGIGREILRCCARDRSGRSYLAAPQGFEPRYADPEAIRQRFPRVPAFLLISL